MSALHNEAFSEFEELGEAEVRRRLATNSVHFMKQEAARAWLTLKEAETKARSEERSEEGLLIARKALANSQLATRIAIGAIVLSVSMAILKLVEWYSK